MALTFGAATSHRINIAASSSINSLDAGTYVMWVYCTTRTNVRRMISTNGTGVTQLLVSGTAGDIRLFKERATTNINFITSDTPLATNTWIYIATTWDVNAGSNTGHIYTGTLSAIASERTYGTAVDGSGAALANAGGLTIGNVAANNQAFQGRIAFAAEWNRALTLAEIRDQQFYPHVTSGCVLFMPVGYNGTGTHPDWSGNGNTGTVTGATLTPDHVPIGPLFKGISSWRGSYTAPTTGTLATTLGAATMAATGTETFSGTLATTLADATMAATGTVTASGVTGTASLALADATLAATGTEVFTGTLAPTLGDATLAAVGSEVFTGTLSPTLGDATLAASGALSFVGTLSPTLADAVFAGTGTETISGTLAATLGDAVMYAFDVAPAVTDLDNGPILLTRMGRMGVK